MASSSPAKPRNASRPRRPEPAELFVYNGRQMLGRIVRAGSVYIARNTDGMKLGEFADARSAMRAICAAARAKRLEAEVASA